MLPDKGSRITGRAWFVRQPNRIEALMRPHPLEAELDYTVVGTVTLSAMEYENFTTDLYADREFLRRLGSLCAMDRVCRCLLVRQRGGSAGLLVIPEDGDYVGYAAYYPGPAAACSVPKQDNNF